MTDVMDGVRTPPPKFVKNMWAWAYTVQKVKDKTGLTPDDEGFNYGMAVAIYKRVARKYGAHSEPEPLTNIAALTTHDRATLLELVADTWAIGHGAAWSANDTAHQRLYLQEHYRVLPQEQGMTVIEPLIVWRVERHEAGDTVRELALSDDMTMWLLRDQPAARAWCAYRMGDADAGLIAAIAEVETVDSTREIRGIPVAPANLDRQATKELMRVTQDRMRAAVSAASA